ncbi:glutathione S-transferase [Ramaria rubella]|nr:glutathione S-transferase [Ramaria rubella]
MAPQITLFSHGRAPNPPKIAILMEELSIEYTLINKNLDFIKINPNGRTPAIIDHTNGDRIVWESGAILLYLAERFDKTGEFIGKTLEDKSDVWMWLFYQVSGLGPSQGQANWFTHFHPVKDIDPSARERYINECYRIFGVLEKRLEGKEYLVLGRFTLADIAHYPWINIAYFATLDLSSFPNVQAYYESIKALPSVVRAYERLAAVAPA